MKSDNRSRRRYEAYYRLLRKGKVNEAREAFGYKLENEVFKAAEYSYQAHGYWVSGWVNRSRREQFSLLINSRYPTYGDIPF